MRFHRSIHVALALTLVFGLSACGSGGGLGGLFGGGAQRQSVTEIGQAESDRALGITRTGPGNRSTFRDLFSKGDNPSTTVKVNKYIWNAALDVLNFLPVESVDPFTGVIVTGYGRPPGGGRAYRATIWFGTTRRPCRAANYCAACAFYRPPTTFRPAFTTQIWATLR